MRTIMGIHLTPTRIRTAVMENGRPVMVRNASGGKAYSFTGIFDEMETAGKKIYHCNIERLTTLFKKILEDVRSCTQTVKWEAVVAVPLSFHGDVLKSIRMAGEQAGLPVLRILRDATAAALEYTYATTGTGEENVLIGVIEGNTVSVTAANCDGDVTEVLATASADSVGKALGWAAGRALRQSKARMDRVLFLGADLKDSPKEQEALRAAEGKSRRAPAVWVDEAAALGAAVQAGILGGMPGMKHVLLLDALVENYSIEVPGNQKVTILAKDTTIPVKKSEIFATSQADQTDAWIHLVRGSGLFAEDDDSVTTLELKNIPRSGRGQQLIEVAVEVDANLSLQIRARVLSKQEMEEIETSSIAGILPVLKSRTDSETLQKAAAPANTAQAAETAESAADSREKQLMAEFDRYRSRSETEKKAMFDSGVKHALENFLPVVDNFERGLAAVPEAAKGDPMAAGMDMIYRQTMKVMSDLGVTPIEAVGKEFSPDLHNAVMQVEMEGVGENIIVEEFQKGYYYQDSVLRYSMVKVNR